MNSRLAVRVGLSLCAVTSWSCGPGSGVDDRDAVRALDARDGAADSGPPETAWLSAPDVLVGSRTVTFEFTSSTAGGAFQCKLDDGDYEPCASPHVVEAGEGVHRFAVYAVDALGVADLTPAEWMWRVDVTPPESEVIGAPPEVDSSRHARFELGASEALVVFECVLDGSLIATGCATGPEIGPLSDGPHELAVYAVDAAGNADPTPAIHHWRVEPHGPAIAIDSGPSGRVAATTAAVEFSAPAAIGFECSLGGDEFTACASPAVFDGLGEGSHRLVIRAIHVDGVIGGAAAGAPVELNWVVDLTSPSTVITEGPASPVNTTSASIELEADEPGVTFTCAVDGVSAGSCQSPFILNDLVEGDHLFEVFATDAAGNREATPVALAWTVDLTPPDAVLTAAPAPAVASAEVAFDGTATEPGATFECSLDGGEFEPCTLPRRYRGLAQGPHAFALRAVDAAGNADPTPATSVWTLDLVGPETTIGAAPQSLTSSRTATFELACSESGCTFECQLDGGGFTACTSPKVYSELDDGSHLFEVRAIDAASNPDPTPAAHTWEVDATEPDTTITGAPAACVVVTAASFAFASTESGNFECQLDGGGFVACNSPLDFSDLSEGPHAFQVRAVDGAGNVDSTPAAETWTVDTTPPQTTIPSGPPAVANTDCATFTFGFSDAGCSGSAAFECSLDGEEFESCTSPETRCALSEGPHTFSVRATDVAGNEDDTPAIHAWTVDTIAPQTTITSGPPTLTSSTTATFNFSCNEPYCTFQCKLDSGSYQNCVSPKTYTGLSAGSHTFRVRATDLAGNTDSSPAQKSWTIDPTPPQTTITSGPSGSVNPTTVTFTFSSSEANSTFKCKLDSGSYTTCSSSKTYSGLSLDSHTFEVYAIDQADNADLSPAKRSFAITAPQTTITNGPYGTIGAISFSFTASQSGSTFQCKMDSGSYASCSSPKTYYNLGFGSHTFRVRAINPANITDGSPATKTWTIESCYPSEGFCKTSLEYCGNPCLGAPCEHHGDCEVTCTVYGEQLCGGSPYPLGLDATGHDEALNISLPEDPEIVVPNASFP